MPLLPGNLLASQEGLWLIICDQSVKLPHVMEPEVPFLCLQQHGTLI